MFTASSPLDLRSDTVTRPTAAMRRAMADAEVGDDVLQDDPTTNRFETIVAERLGKDKALFFPSGTMANQAAIWVLSTPGTEIYVDAESHVVHSEVAGAAALCGVQVRPVRARGLVMTAADLVAHVRTPTADAPEASLVCMENTHNGAGGVVTPLDGLHAIRETAQQLGLPMHLDGARLWNAAAASGTPLEAFAACADTVMVSFSKGLGAPVGACLAGPADVITRARRVRKRFGGGMRQSGVLTAAAHHALTHHLDRLPEDHAAARLLAERVDGVGGAQVVAPQTNIVMIDLPEPSAAAVVARAAERGVRIGQWHPSRVRAVTHLDAPIEAVRPAADILAEVLAEVLA
ncbi:MAG: threonine aldolase family protein [Gemmatimonas sp.]|jgi:threonine aldolase|uniref:threonine aldolase family protein n=1 Tax=Gemmatimonas sp. TaxID=1962908 RepID=UPI00391F886C|nr:aminotransferase class I/II-fold pyridoxal phosphate-dependent enzyme [Gemmatimonadota bacterium]